MSIQYEGVNHLAMVTGDMDATIRFWRDLLEMELVIGMGRPGYRHYFFRISATDLLAFFEWPEAEPVPEKDHGYPVKGSVCFDHVSIGVRTEEDLWTIKQRLEAAQFWVSEVIDHGFIHSIYSFDPNGIPIEFSVGVRGVDPRAHPVLIDSQPSRVTREGPQPQPGHWPEPEPIPPPSKRALYPGEGQQLLTGPNGWEQD